MSDQQHDFESETQHLQEEDILDDVLGGGDFIDDLHGLQGIVSAALGRLGFRFSFVVVLLFNFVYTVYNAFSKKIKPEASAITFNNCSCDPIDRVIYNLTTFGCITLWIIFLLICAFYSIYKLIVKSQCCTSYKADSSDEELIPDWLLKREFSKLATKVFI